jgi:hypothetical protein
MKFGSFDDGRQWCEMSRAEWDALDAQGVAFAWAFTFSRCHVTGGNTISRGDALCAEQERDFAIVAALEFAREHQAWWIVEAVEDFIMGDTTT